MTWPAMAGNAAERPTGTEALARDSFCRASYPKTAEHFSGSTLQPQREAQPVVDFGHRARRNGTNAIAELLTINGADLGDIRHRIAVEPCFKCCQGNVSGLPRVGRVGVYWNDYNRIDP